MASEFDMFIISYWSCQVKGIIVLTMSETGLFVNLVSFCIDKVK